MIYVKLRKRGGGIAFVPAESSPCVSMERVGKETLTLVSIPGLDLDYEVTERPEDIMTALGAEVKETLKNDRANLPEGVVPEKPQTEDPREKGGDPGSCSQASGRPRGRVRRRPEG